MNLCGSGYNMDLHVLLGALVILCNALSAYVVVKTRRNGDAETPRGSRTHLHG